MRLPSVRSTVNAAHVERRALLASALSVLSIAPNVMIPKRASAISATTMTGKTKADLGMYLVEEPKQTGATISGDVVLNGGIIATATFDSQWALSPGGYNDVEASNREGDTAFMQIATLGRGDKLAPKFFADKIFSVDGRYGAYGQPVDVKIKPSAGAAENEMLFDISFSTLTPGGSEVPRKGVVRAIQAKGSSDILMLVCTASASRWKKEGADAASRKTAASFRIADTRPTDLKAEPPSDYRYGKSSGPSNMTSRNDGF